MKPRVAVIGGGIGGLSAGHFLRSDFEVTLFEGQSRVGGNAYCLKVDDDLEIDIAVAAFGKVGYKNFFRLLGQLGIETRRAGGSISIHDLDTQQGLYISPSWSGLVAQKFALLKPSRLWTLLQLGRGLRRAHKIQARGGFDGLTVREGLRLVPQIRGDGETNFLCVLCLLSSMSGDQVLEAPASFFFEKLAIHSDVVSLKSVYSLRTVPGGTKRYVKALAESFDERIVLDARIKAVRRHDEGGATLEFEDGSEQHFDKVVMACNADQALELLADPTELETELLSPWRYMEGPLVLHDDHSAFPARPLLQAFTFLYRRENGGLETSVNGMIRYLAGVPKSCDLIGSQHPNFPIREDAIKFQTVFRTPIFDFNSCATTARLPELNGTKDTYYCGSHFGHGLHEDAITSALAIAESLGADAWG